MHSQTRSSYPSPQRIVRMSTLNDRVGFCTATAASNRSFGDGIFSPTLDGLYHLTSQSLLSDSIELTFCTGFSGAFPPFLSCSFCAV